MRALVLISVLSVAACAPPAGLTEQEEDFTSRTEDERAPKGLETLTTSKTTRAMFKRKGLAKLQRTLAARLPSLRRAQDAGLPDSGVEKSIEVPEALEVNGTLDEPTQQVLGAWQRSEGLAETGLPDYLTLSRLGLDPAEVFHHRPGPPNSR